MNEFPGPQERIQRILDSALVDCTYVSTLREHGGGSLVVTALRSDGQQVGVRFRGMREGDGSGGPEPGLPISVRSVKREGASLLSRLLPLFVPAGPMYARVRIDVGPATLDIVCQDAEWWEE